MGVQLTALPKCTIFMQLPKNAWQFHLHQLNSIIRNYQQKSFQLFKFIFFFCAAKTIMQLRTCTQPSFYPCVLCLS